MIRGLLLIFCLTLLGCGETKEPEVVLKEARALNECTMTCPKCGHKKKEIMRTDQCVGQYTCEACHVVLFPKDEDCCVYCSYSDTLCPPEQ